MFSLSEKWKLTEKSLYCIIKHLYIYGEAEIIKGGLAVACNYLISKTGLGRFCSYFWSPVIVIDLETDTAL